MQATMELREQQDAGGSFIHSTSNCPDENVRYSISVIEMLGELMNLDPMKVSFYLNDHVKVEFLNELHGYESLCVSFLFGGYTVYCSSSGYISVYGNKVDHERGRVPAPDSMRDNLEIETVPADTESENRIFQSESGNL